MPYGMLALALLFLILAYPRQYRLIGGRLQSWFGLIRANNLDLAKVERVAVEPGRHPETWFPAQGVRLHHGKRSMFCVPEDQAAFLDALAEACPTLYRYGNELRRRP